MALRLQEIHPSLVHFPIALLPTALAADAVGRLSGSQELMDTGRRLMPVAAASAALAGVAGLIAQESSRVGEEMHPVLDTHRNLNVAVTLAAAAMAIWRAGRDRPGLGYLLAGAAGVVTTVYSAYLGGHMVYEHGVGVKPADGLWEDEAPEVTRGREAWERSLGHVRRGVEHSWQAFKAGSIAPALGGHRHAGNGAEAAPEE